MALEVMKKDVECRTKNSWIITGVSTLILALALSACSGPISSRLLQQAKADAESVDRFMGDWKGDWNPALVSKREEGEKVGKEFPLVAQVIALGDGKYQANLLPEFDKRIETFVVLEGQQRGSAVYFQGQSEDEKGRWSKWQAAIDESGSFTGFFFGRKGGEFVMHKVYRLSPTLGAKPPAGAVVLFDGKDLDQWEHADKFPGLIDLAKIMGDDLRSDSVMYLRSEIWSDKQQKAKLQTGCDELIKAFLNGRVVYADKEWRGINPGQDRAKVTLEQGFNELMLKVTQDSGRCEVFARLVDADGNALSDISEKDIYSSKDGPTRKYLDKFDGYLTVWRISGPYRWRGENGKKILDVVFPPEKPGAEDVKWRVIDNSEFGDIKRPQWKVVDGAMEVKPDSGSIISKKKFKNFKLHLEFRTPFMPDDRGQNRGNSGIYLQGKYEVQILDSYGLEGRHNECGGIYEIADPIVNMCAPPMQWQTYDITFYAPCFDAAGRKVKNAVVTVLHNGVKIHDNLEMPHPTPGGAGGEQSEPGGIYIQDHSNTLRCRNIWVVELP